MNEEDKFRSEEEVAEPYDVADPYDARQVSLEQLRHWELAPANPARVAQAEAWKE